MTQDPKNTPGKLDDEMAAFLNPGLRDYYLNDKQGGILSGAVNPTPVGGARAVADNVLPAKDRWFFTKFAEGKQKAEGYDKFKTSSYQGLTPDEVTRMENAQEALRIAEQTANLSDQEFEQVSNHMADGMGHTASPVIMPTLRDPNWQQGLAGAIGALVDPQHAAEIGASAFNAQQQAQQQEFQQAQLNHQAEQEQIQANNEVNRLRTEIAQAKMLKDSKRVEYLQGTLSELNKTISARQLKEFEQGEITKRALIGLDKTGMAQAGALERKYLDKMATAQTPEARQGFGEMLRDQFPDKYGNLTDEQIATIATKNSKEFGTEAKTAKTWFDIKKGEMLLVPQYAQAWANVEKTIQQTAKYGADTKLIEQKVLLYPMEFRQRAANIYSQIEKRTWDMAHGKRTNGKLSESDLPTSQEITDLGRQIEILKGQEPTVSGPTDSVGLSNYHSWAQELSRLEGKRQEFSKQRAEAVMQAPPLFGGFPGAGLTPNSKPLPGPKNATPFAKPKAKQPTSKYRRGPNGEIIRN